jgi:purine nucleosidase/pyrimidine-specific ribonucleoside hydrolase
MVGLNVTHQALAGPEVLDRIAAIGSPLSAICLQLLGFYGAAYRSAQGFRAPPVHDPVALAAVIAPDIVGCTPARVDIELTGEHTRGATVVDFGASAPNADVATSVDAAAFWDLLIAAIAACSAQ